MKHPLGLALSFFLMLSLVTTTATSQEDEWLRLKKAARTEFANANPEKAKERLEALLSLYRPAAANQSRRGTYEWSSRLIEVSQEYLRAGELPDAMRILGEEADLNLSLRSSDDSGLVSAAGALHRRLVQLDADERYELLHKWSMPTESRPAVRVLNSIVPSSAPPNVFARAIGERPRKTSFQVARVGDISGVFSTAWELVKAADETGRLRRLKTELSVMRENAVPNADFVLKLAQIAGSGFDRDDDVYQHLARYLAVLRREQNPDRNGDGPFAVNQVWQFGYGWVDANKQRTVEFKVLPHWTGWSWQGSALRPDPKLGWLSLRAGGGSPDRHLAVIRRWVAPKDGTISVTGQLGHASSRGDGVRGRVVSNRFGVCGEWVVHDKSMETEVESVEVNALDTIDFVVDALTDPDSDHFDWTVQLDLEPADGDRIRFNSSDGFHGPSDSTILPGLVLASACLQRTWLQGVAEEILVQLVEDTKDRESLIILAALRRAHTVAVQKRFPGTSDELLSHIGLRDWVATSAYDSTLNAQGTIRPIWLAHEDHVLHLAGPRHDYLLFRYPLVGDFDFSCDAQDGGRGGTEGGIVYAGLAYDASGAGQSFRVRDTDFRNEIDGPCPFVRAGRRSFNRFSLKSTSEGVTFKANGHPVWTDKSTVRSSPWIGLQSFNDRRLIFRNLKIIGDPVIPREVRMIDGNLLRGWMAGYYGQWMPSTVGRTRLPVESEETGKSETADWHAKDGVLYGTHQPSRHDGVIQSRLYYIRPLLDDESISYEFIYKPGEFEVHPTLGRLAFLIQPDGVRLRWLTDGDREWTGLAADNTVVDITGRRGARLLRLREDDWNKLTLALKDGTVTLSLNGVEIFERKMEPENDLKFGFYHDRNKSAVRIRNVVMRGDWPKRLTPDQLNNLADASGAARTKSDRHALTTIFQDKYIAENALAIHRQAARMPPRQRFDYLARWVLPSIEHPTFRLVGQFTATQPAPPAIDRDPVDARRLLNAKTSGQSRVQIGGNLVAPALDLVEVAKESDRLDELRKRIEQSPTSNEHARRSRLALLLLVDLAGEDVQGAVAIFDKLFIEVENYQASEHSVRWPETLVLLAALESSVTRKLAFELLNTIYGSQQSQWRNAGSPTPLELHINALRGLHKYLSSADANVEGFTSPPALKHWFPVSHTTAASRGAGCPRPHWQMDGSRVDSFAGHNTDYLLYDIPLRGDYQVECDLASFGLGRSHLMVAGHFVSPLPSLKSFQSGSFRGGRRNDIDPPLARMVEWIRFRAVVRGGVLTAYINDRKVQEIKRPADHPPWLAIRNVARYPGGVRDLRIVGDPVIPDQINMSALFNLNGWAAYFGESVGKKDSDWRLHGGLPDGSEIVGSRRLELPGSGMQRLLRYHRPMLEDGEIEYEFFYKPGETITHPALDRLAFLLDPQGVRIHWITDGRYDRTGLDPANAFVEKDNLRGPDELPLKPGEWNRMRLKLKGDKVDLELNDQLVYQRELELTNQRTFGLFHFADRTEARVRNIVWKGDWPRELPAVQDQELASNKLEFLEKKLPELKSVFEHDFSRDGLPDKYFHKFGPDGERFLSAQPDGIHAVRPGTEKFSHTGFGHRFRVQGDFDITVTFNQLKTQLPSSCTAQLLAILQGESTYHVQIQRTHLEKWQRIHAQATEIGPDGARRGLGNHQVSEAESGRFRIARRGDRAYFLFAQGDSPVFRLIATESVSTDEIVPNGIRLSTVTRGTGNTSVVWKNLSIRAEKLLHVPNQGEPVKRLLYVMNADGTKLRQLTERIGNFEFHGSPAWSPDGTKIAFDTWGGGPSRIYIVNADGKELKKLAAGNMPSFSPDGKRLAFSYGSGLATINVDGTDQKTIASRARNGQWSPDGKMMSFDSGGNVVILDLKTNERRMILEGDHARRYSSIYWNQGWSKDSMQVCFKAKNRASGKYEIAVVNVTGSSKGFQVLYENEAEMTADFSWHPSGKLILFSMHAPELKGTRLFTLNPKMRGLPQLLRGQPEGYKNYDADYSADGKQIAFASQRPLEWKEWTGKVNHEHQEPKRQAGAE